MVFDPDLIWKPKKNYKIFNAQGFRGKEVSFSKGPNEYRILAVGDSNTLGITFLPAWPEYLEELMKNSRPQTRVINAGVWGYSSWQGLKRFEEMLVYQPDVVIISFGANDAHKVSIPDKEYVKTTHFFNKSISRLKLCQLYFFIKDFIMIKAKKGQNPVSRVSLNEYQDNLLSMVEIAQKNKIKIILLTRPFVGESKNESWWKNTAPQYNKLTLNVAHDKNLPAIDMYSYFKDKEKEYFVDEGHFNDEGNKFAAEIIYNYINKEIY